VVDRMSDTIGTALNDTITGYAPEYEKSQAPTLSFFAFQDANFFLSDETMTKEQQTQVIKFFETARLAWVQKSIELFRRNVPHAKIVEIPHGNHYCFITHEEHVFEEMRAFLLS
jgi:pimeloyl-ACP methyl ester carboxylesterase